jgi:hypothetical protein
MQSELGSAVKLRVASQPMGHPAQYSQNKSVPLNPAASKSELPQCIIPRQADFISNHGNRIIEGVPKCEIINPALHSRWGLF